MHEVQNDVGSSFIADGTSGDPSVLFHFQEPQVAGRHVFNGEAAILAGLAEISPIRLLKDLKQAQRVSAKCLLSVGCRMPSLDTTNASSKQPQLSTMDRSRDETPWNAMRTV